MSFGLVMQLEPDARGARGGLPGEVVRGRTDAAGAEHDVVAREGRAEPRFQQRHVVSQDLHPGEFQAARREHLRLIPNPINQIPGFSLHDHHFVPGFPNMAWPMLDWVLDTYYSQLGSGSVHEYSYKVVSPESDLVPAIKAVMNQHPEVKVASLPSTERHGEVELSVRGSAEQARAAAAQLTERLSADGVQWQLLDGAAGD